MISIIIIILLIIIIIGLIYFIRTTKAKLTEIDRINQKVKKKLATLSEFLRVAGEEDSVDEKLRKINEIIIENYDIKYSTIVIFDGAEYVIKASNVDPKHYDVLTNLHNEEYFQDSVATATPKSLTIENENERLPYQKSEFGRAKSAVFVPLYIDNIYIGYWIMESGKMDGFKTFDLTVIEALKEDILAILQTISYQDTIENIVRTDKFTGLQSAEYLYGDAKKIIDKYTTSAVCMFRIANIEEINETTNRKIGNEIIAEVSNIVRAKMPDEYVFVRYMGPKFVIVFSGVEEGSLEEFLQDMKQELEELEIIEDDGEYEYTATPRINFVISTYYKGTALDNLTKKLEEYLDSAPRSENQINYI
ncbi:MAG: diguanylate cyclase [Clostridia bacterium]|nr:diguanylate cyclase [Clostridia bacterium]